MLSEDQTVTAQMNRDAAFAKFLTNQDQETRMEVVAAICPSVTDSNVRKQIVDTYAVDLAFFTLERRQETYNKLFGGSDYDSDEDPAHTFWADHIELTRAKIVSAVRRAAAALAENDMPASKRARTEPGPAGGSQDE